MVLALPEDMLSEEAEAADPQRYQRIERTVARGHGAVRELLAAAKRPLCSLAAADGTQGGRAGSGLRRGERAAGRGVFPAAGLHRQRHACYVGDVGIGINPKLAQKVRDADLLLVLGARLSEMATGGYTLIEAPSPRQKLIHVHADPGELGGTYQADLPIAAGPRGFAAALAQVKPVDGGAWRGWSGGRTQGL